MEDSFDPSNLGWVDSDNEDEPFVKEITLSKAQLPRRHAPVAQDWDPDVQVSHTVMIMTYSHPSLLQTYVNEDDESNARLRYWATSERSSRSVIGRGNTSGASAVTGHKKRGLAAASKRGASNGQSNQSGKQSNSVIALSAISNKWNKFGPK